MMNDNSTYSDKKNKRRQKVRVRNDGIVPKHLQMTYSTYSFVQKLKFLVPNLRTHNLNTIYTSERK